MTYKPKIILHCPISDTSRLEALVEQCLADGVSLLAVFGAGAAEVEEEIDWIVVGDGNDHNRFLLTSAHPDEPLADVIAFAAGCEPYGVDAQEIWL